MHTKDIGHDLTNAHLKHLEQHRHLKIHSTHVHEAKTHATQIATEELNNHPLVNTITQAELLKLPLEVATRRRAQAQLLARLALIPLGDDDKHHVNLPQHSGNLLEHRPQETEEQKHDEVRAGRDAAIQRMPTTTITHHLKQVDPLMRVDVLPQATGHHRPNLHTRQEPNHTVTTHIIVDQDIDEPNHQTLITETVKPHLATLKDPITAHADQMREALLTEHLDHLRTDLVKIEATITLKPKVTAQILHTPTHETHKNALGKQLVALLTMHNKALEHQIMPHVTDQQTETLNHHPQLITITHHRLNDHDHDEQVARRIATVEDHEQTLIGIRRTTRAQKEKLINHESKPPKRHPSIPNALAEQADNQNDDKHHDHRNDIHDHEHHDAPPTTIDNLTKNEMYAQATTTILLTTCATSATIPSRTIQHNNAVKLH